MLEKQELAQQALKGWWDRSKDKEIRQGAFGNSESKKLKTEWILCTKLYHFSLKRRRIVINPQLEFKKIVDYTLKD